MGAPMLGALLRGGCEARGLDIRPVSEFGALAAHVTTDVARFGAGLKTAITVVRDIAQTDALLFGPEGLLTHAPGLEVLIISSTLSPRYVLGLRDRVPDRIALIDAPMSGAEVKAKSASLSFMTGGCDIALDLCAPLFEAMGAHTHRMGPYGAGMQAKVLNNLLAASNTVMTRLVLDWADQAALDEAGLLALINTSSGQNWLASGFEEIEFARKGYDAGNTLGILKKDVESALDAAPEGADTDLPELLAQMVGQLKPRP